MKRSAQGYLLQTAGFNDAAICTRLFVANCWFQCWSDLHTVCCIPQVRYGQFLVIGITTYLYTIRELEKIIIIITLHNHSWMWLAASVPLLLYTISLKTCTCTFVYIFMYLTVIRCLAKDHPTIIVLTWFYRSNFNSLWQILISILRWPCAEDCKIQILLTFLTFDVVFY